MDRNELAKIIHSLEEVLMVLKKEVGTPVVSVSAKKATKPSINKGKSKKTVGATEPIKELMGSGFFDTGKSDLDVMTILKKKTLRFSRSGVAVPLMRLVRAGQLTREGEGTRTEPWRYTKV